MNILDELSECKFKISKNEQKKLTEKILKYY